MVLQSVSAMSVTPSTTLDSQLTATWSPTNSYPDVPMVTSGYTNRLWLRDSQPQFWSKFQVWEWLQQVMDMHQIDASSVPFQNFDMDGHQLCSLNYQDFIHAAGSVGPILFHSITELKWSGQYHVELGQLEIKPELDFSCSFSDGSYPPEDIYDTLIPHVAPVASPTPSSPVEESTKHTTQHDIKRSFSRQVKKHNKRGTHLWEFIRDILLNPERNPGLIKWEDRTEGVFRFLKSNAVADLWGKKKNNSSMTYEKLSRAMRYYYKRGILERVDGRRLVYKFGNNARGWRESDM
ncbi:ETS homologous factor isoform X1 [Anarrhichthys ocellatus]|uniref:ETS homologous factor isoform X1 n=1 Tax=Anarrhichthys ocellatus TaxID=433405 RepID=UPI0012EDC2D4|nr:ETS homologous factor isoform X1 [Anarrhichthys ocellatus]